MARSAEAKALGIKMGDPEFKLRELIRRENIRVFSSNWGHIKKGTFMYASDLLPLSLNSLPVGPTLQV